MHFALRARHELARWMLGLARCRALARRSRRCHRSPTHPGGASTSSPSSRDPAGAHLGGHLRTGIFVLPPRRRSWEPIRSDTTHGSLSWDFVHRDRVRPARRGLVRHRRERLGPVARRRKHLAQLDPRAARPRVAVRGAGRDRDPGRHDGDRDGGRRPDDHRRRRALDRDRGRHRPGGPRPRRHRLRAARQRVHAALTAGDGRLASCSHAARAPWRLAAARAGQCAPRWRGRRRCLGAVATAGQWQRHPRAAFAAGSDTTALL